MIKYLSNNIDVILRSRTRNYIIKNKVTYDVINSGAKELKNTKLLSQSQTLYFAGGFNNFISLKNTGFMTWIKAIRKLWLWLTLFSIAMGFLESAVVQYLREISYPGGFEFPLVPIDNRLAITEVIREAATIIMLIAVSCLSGRTLSERFAWFLYCFATWDIFYYIFLKLLIGWPASLMTWDVLFLIPAPWVGPVIAPIIISFTMILFAATILYFSYRQEQSVRIHTAEWILLITGSVILILSFTWDYYAHVLPVIRNNGLNRMSSISQWIYRYVPKRFNWLLFIAGEAVILTGIFNFFKRNRKKYTN